MMHRLSLVLAVCGLVVFQQAAGAEPVAAPVMTSPDAPQAVLFGIGEKAPTLEGASWLKGESVTGYEKGQIYVLDFWATWCGPCIAGIPHMAEIQTKYADKGVNVIGVAIWPRPGQKPTKDFVTERGEKMPYRIAEDVNNLLAKRFMEPAGMNGIPTVMIIDRDGALAWVGHPNPSMDRALDRIITEPDYARKRATVEKKAAELGQALATAADAKDWARCLEIMDEFVALDSKDFAQFNLFKYDVMLARMKDTKAAAAHGRALVEGTFADDSEMLNMLAWYISNPAGEVPQADRDYELALLAANRANEITGGADPAVLDTLARVHFAKGDSKEAARLQALAVEAAKEPRMKAELQRLLEQYTKAAEGG